MIFNNKTNEIKENIDKIIIKIYNYNNNNSGNNSKHLKFISFFINNKSDYFKQLRKVVIIISTIFNDAEIDNVLSLIDI